MPANSHDSAGSADDNGNGGDGDCRHLFFDHGDQRRRHLSLLARLSLLRSQTHRASSQAQFRYTPPCRYWVLLSAFIGA
ncbi:MAG TPA: hypothetical protein VL485_09630 [Ktedonobacteraceae bacterium]|nr:hypothetical protein [Ktedonobacteraceae bacterium]